jgi:BirA family biotin operon repressor/biotin-[acetyl-CoA-carboxylase] ligase
MVSAKLQRHAISWDPQFIPRCDSTQGLARNAIDAGAGPGWLALTDFQVRGRGRQGRSWDAPPGRALLFSALLRSPVTTVSLTPLLAGLAVGQGIAAATGLPIELKWPNDVLVGGRKLGGVLCERPSGMLVIVGVGVNVNQSEQELSAELAATSIAIELGHHVAREPVLVALLNAFDDHWQRAAREGDGWIVSAWRSRSPMLGREVTFNLGGVQQAGMAEDISPDGALVIRAADGRLTTVSAGDVREVRTLRSQS